MTKLLRLYSVLLTCFLLVLSMPLFGQNGSTTTSCVGDTLPPFFERCPQNIVLTTTDSCAFAQWTPPLAFDNCGIYTVLGSHQSGTCFNIGTTMVNYTAVDSSGNKTLCSFTITVNRPTTDVCATDTIKPVFVRCPDNLIFTTSDSCMHVQWETPTATDNCGTPSVIGSIPAGSCFGVGTKDVVYYAKDANGNITRCVFSVTILRPNIDSILCENDTIKPRFLTCPLGSMFTLSATSANLDSCMRVQWPTPTAVDNCSTPTISSSIQSGSCLPVGSTTVVYTAVDTKGNTATCSFTLTVNRPNLDSICATDTIKPRFVTCPTSSMFTLSATTTNLDSCMRVQWPTPTAVDNCSTPTISSSIQSGSCLPVGSTTVVYTAVDAKGNTSTCSFTLTVNRPNLDSICATDTIKPRFVTCPTSSMFTLPATSTNLDSCMHVQWATPTAVDNCGTPTITGSIAPGTCFGIGTKDVVYYAIDAKGNTAKCVFSITVNRPNLDSICATDTIKPRFVTCPTSSIFTLPATSANLDSCTHVQWATPTAVDNCGTTSVSSSLQSGSCLPVGSTTVVYTAADATGNTATCSFTVTVIRPNIDSILCANDTIRPRFENCPISSTFALSATSTNVDSCMRVQWPTPTAFDNCSTTSVSSSLQSGSCLPVGTTTVVYTAVDAKGNIATCSFSVTVIRPSLDSICVTDTIKPRFVTCPTSSMFTLSATSPNLDSCMRVQWPTPTAVDNCGPPSVSSSLPSGSCLPVGSTTVVYTATDAKGNTSTCSFIVTVNRPNLDSICATDTIKPRFVTCPTSSMFTLSATSLDSCMRVQWATPTATDNCSTPTLTSSLASGSCIKVGTTTVVYTAVDAKGNTATCSFTVTVNRPNLDSICATDTIKPRFTNCPISTATGSITNFTYTTSDSCMRVQWPTLTAVDNCGVPTITGSLTSGACLPVGITPVVYTATDAKGNQSICSFNITVLNPCANDTIKPRFSSCPTNKSVTTKDSCVRVSWTTPLAYDNCGTPTVSSNFTQTSCFPIGTTPVIYTATDRKGNQTTCSFKITVVNPCATDSIKPRFVNCPTNKTLTTFDTCARIQWTAPIATDNCSTPVVTSNFPATACFPIGVSNLVYTATDAKGNTAICSLTVTVVNPCATDSIKPRFTSCPQSIKLNSLDTCIKIKWNTPTATDNCSTPVLTSNFKPGACFKEGTTVVTYTATDIKGNSSICSFTVTIVNPCANDTIKPRFTNCPTNKTLTTLDSCARIQWSTPTAYDNCGTPVITNNLPTSACFPVGTTPVIYTATDAKGNQTTCSFTVTVVNPCANDTLKPRFTSCPQNIVINSLDTCAKATWNKPLATDNCSTPTVAGNFTSGTCFSTGTTAVTYTATDAKGNSSVCSFTVTVKNPCTNDTIKPTFYNCPANITKETGDSSTTVTWRTPAATDNCVVRSITTSHPSGSRFNIGTTTVTYAATDAAGNTRYCTFTVTIKHVITPCSVDSIAPVLANCPADISLTTASASAVAQWKKPTATDNCSTPSVVGTANPGASFPLGTTTVFYTATDAKRNVSTCSFNVVVTKQALVIDSTKCYILVARSSKKALSIANASTAPGADAVQWSYTGGANQKWGITTADSNSVNLTVKHTNLNLDTRWGSLANGSKLMQWAKSTAATQKWQLIPLSDGYYKIINKGSGRALSVNGGTTVTADGSLLVQSTYAGLTSQQWSIEAVACTSTGTSPSAYTTNDVLEANATAELHRARIEWVDNTGYKNDYYEVEKLNTTSGKFESLAIINNKSFDNQLSSQTAYDEAPTEGDNFYRVKVVYLDSLTKVSPVQKVAFSNLQTVKIFPNPASDYVDIDLATYSNETVNIDLYNGFGQKVAAKTVQKGNNSTVHFDISEQQNGNYLIRITAQGKRDVVKQLNIVR